MTASVGLTAALRAAATPLFNQAFYTELRKKLKRHKKPCIHKLRASDMCKIKRRRHTCEARIVANFLVWTSKLSKL